MFDYLKTVCTDIHITRGNFDEAAAKYPEDEVRDCLTDLPDLSPGKWSQVILWCRY